MILFLRDQNNNSIVDLECYVSNEDGHRFVELHVTVDIMYYSVLLLGNLHRKEQVIADFSEIQELRGWLWEKYFMGSTNDPDKYDDVIAELRKILKTVGEKYELGYVED
jgi:hypothetical protein